jgi:glycosyltransferase involved in cell wall biosynthesis
MKIVFQSRTPLPVARYGGTERMQYWLMKELVRQGHRVAFIGPKESQVANIGVQLIPYAGEADWSSSIPSDANVVHLFEEVIFKVPVPYIVTIGGNGQPGQTFDQNAVFVSAKHARNHGSDRYVYNGIDFDEYPWDGDSKKGWDQFLFLAKASWSVKNLKHCVKSCRAAKKHLHIGGGRSLTLSRYIHSYGLVDQSQKQRLFAKTDALLFPVRWEEPFGIAIVEAFAMGLPVVGSPYGSLPELITEGMGVLVRNYDELLSVVGSTRPQSILSPSQLRQEALRRYSMPVVAGNYLALYEEVQGGRPLNTKPPQAQFKERPENLLPF